MLRDVFLIYFTYPSGMLRSFDRGDTWEVNDPLDPFDFGYPCIIDENNIFAWEGGLLVKTDYRESYIDTLYDLDFGLTKIYFYDDRLGFVIGYEGNILRTTNGGGTVGIDEGEELKKTLRSFQTL